MKLKLKYVYDFYNNGDLTFSDIFEQSIEILNAPQRFTLHDQEDASFIVSGPLKNHVGTYVTLTYPNKDIIMIYLGTSQELVYDEYYSAMGDDNHNVYEGSVSLED